MINELSQDFICRTDYLSKNLEHYYKLKPYTRIGTGTSFDINKNKYITYGLTFSREFFDCGLSPFIKYIDSIIEGLICAKSHEKNEGEEIKNRDVIVEWRQFPEVVIEDYFTFKGKLTFRISVYCKE